MQLHCCLPLAAHFLCGHGCTQEMPHSIRAQNKQHILASWQLFQQLLLMPQLLNLASFIFNCDCKKWTFHCLSTASRKVEVLETAVTCLQERVGTSSPTPSPMPLPLSLPPTGTAKWATVCPTYNNKRHGKLSCFFFYFIRNLELCLLLPIKLINLICRLHITVIYVSVNICWLLQTIEILLSSLHGQRFPADIKFNCNLFDYSANQRIWGCNLAQCKPQGHKWLRYIIIFICIIYVYLLRIYLQSLIFYLLFPWEICVKATT